MEVILAGCNVDYGVISDFATGRLKGEQLTPETIAAAYARISRDGRRVDELRALARQEVEKARQSNRNIVFGMGHNSIAEHAVFNFDILNVSRLFVEMLERSRLASYTEKSQRYVLLQDDFVMPPEVREAGLESVFRDAVGEQNDLYHRLYERLRSYVFKEHPELARDQANHTLLEGWAKEDARYVIALATETQLGMTVNARSLERMIRHLAASSLSEARDCGRRLYEVAVRIAPSLVRHVEPQDYDRPVGEALTETMARLRTQPGDIPERERGGPVAAAEEVKLLGATADADDRVVASLLHSADDLSWEECRGIVAKMDVREKAEVIKTVCRQMQVYDSVRREFENVALHFELEISASCFAQLKRHRMATITCQEYNPILGFTVPQAICEVGMERDFRETMARTEAVYYRIKKVVPAAAAYILTNAHRRRVGMKINARELYHIARLRADQHAQWDIRNIADRMMALGREVMPLTLMLAAGKDNFPSLVARIYPASAGSSR